MFKQVKSKLTFLYTISLLCVLILFIGLLYFFISHEINQKQLDEIDGYFNKEKMDFIEDLYEKKHHDVEYDPNRSIFYYVCNQENTIIYGKETVRNLFGHIELTEENSFIKKIDWGKNHFLIVKKPLTANGATHGFVILGTEITGEKHLIQNITWTLIGMTMLFSLLFAFLGYYFAGQAMKPIKRAFLKQEKFVSDASHELRTPLSIFYSSIDLLQREEKLSAYGQEVLKDAKVEAELMNKLIHNLLFLARSDQKELPLKMKRVNFSELLKNLCKRFSRREGLSIDFIVDIQKGISLRCDEIKMQELVYILLDNAFRYTGEGMIAVRLNTEGGKIILMIEDTGCGISETHLPHIFDRFYQADGSREKGGTGLGLSIAKTIVILHGGQIIVDSKEGEGSKFTVIFNEEK
ncbi:HAMP domain-containing sensor histidine kinase [Neobacillus niacini]|uniref:sensor histidine kinase n=1 Tax=Neobacillus niacini TaxID=86668 RepID=UPI0028604ABA|nr:HAMP domain-containing sensor histidine kinase [Neobacillus niacini]MDR6998475.1 signal transduction histidine kinase [Neobacillus niacini]